jgi:hypothetical protein
MVSRLTLVVRMFLGLASCVLALGWGNGLTASERGATVPWTTYEAEDMVITGGMILGPPGRAADKNQHLTNTVEMEASGGRCVKLAAAGSSVEFVAKTPANAIVVRYCIPDSDDGTGIDSTLALFVNGSQVATLPVTSRYSWRYGSYTFTNKPSDGNPRNVFDEVRCKGLTIAKNDAIRIAKASTDAAAYCIIDLVDLESIPEPRIAPANSLSVMSYGASGQGLADDTKALQDCINAARNQHRDVWIPPGTYLIAGDMNNIQDITIQGAGMWHTTLVGDPAQYNQGTSKQVRLNGGGNNIHIADFAIIGRLNHRNDGDANDGFSEFFGTGSTISRIWVEHTKTGAWIANSSGLIVDSCRFRNTIADGINLCVGVRGSTIQNCTARGCGDDAFAIWPATYTAQTYAPGLNVIKNCTACLSSLGNGIGIYGGEGNVVQDCLIHDVPYGCGILVSGTFPIGKNVFSGTTTVQRCAINRCGGFDSGWNAWRAAVTICPQDNNISGLTITDLTVTNSISYAIEIVSPGSAVANASKGHLTNAILANVTVSTFGVAVPIASEQPYVDGVYGLWARSDAIGSMTVRGLTINGALGSAKALAGSAMKNDSNKAQGAQTFSFDWASP